jgi:cytochrome c oxidase subunit 4
MDHKHDDKHGHAHGDHGGHKLVPIKYYVVTLLALLVLTVLTVGVSYVDLGKFNIVANLGIACVKASLVLLFFMGLRWDTALNRAFILSSFGALAILLFFCATDLWNRPKPEPLVIKQMASSLSLASLPAYISGSPELVAKGKAIFEVNCAVCHGLGGNGDGAGGAALIPKPRNFHADPSAWTHGNTAMAIYYTLAYGANGGMASYKSLLPEDRWALVHYVMSFHQEGPKSAKGNFEAEGDKQAKADVASAGGALKPTLPIDFAIQRLAP